jgi:chemotaxis protein CheX
MGVFGGMTVAIPRWIASKITPDPYAENGFLPERLRCGEVQMDVEIINPFVEGAVHVLKTMASTDARAEAPYVKKDRVAKGDVSSVIGLTGEAKGTVSVTFTGACILDVVSRMFGEQMEDLNEEIGDAVGEIANMISGYARQKLEERGRSLKAAIPTVVMGKDHRLSYKTNCSVIAIPFTTDSGKFTIEVCFEE